MYAVLIDKEIENINYHKEDMAHQKHDRGLQKITCWFDV